MSDQDPRLDEFATKILTELKKRKKPDDKIHYIKGLLFDIPIIHHLVFPQELSTREIQVLYFAALGATICETAKEINVKPSTVISYRKESIRKMRCKNITEAVFKCFCYGLLPRSSPQNWGAP